MVTELLLAMASLLAVGNATPQRLTVHHDLPYTSSSDVRRTLDVYAPANAEGAAMVVFVHGGGLLFGDKTLIAHVGQRLAKSGIVTVAPNHRFSPAVKHPAHVEDAAAAVAWALKNASSLGADPRRVIIAGHSSGGYLVALLATDPRWLEAAGTDRKLLRAVAPISGFFHVPRLAPERPKSVWGEDPAVWEQASPAFHVDADVPPMLLLYADGDDAARKAENVDFATALRGQGAAEPRLIEVQQRDHRSIFTALNLPDDAAMAALLDFIEIHAGKPD